MDTVFLIVVCCIQCVIAALAGYWAAGNYSTKRYVLLAINIATIGLCCWTFGTSISNLLR